MKKILLVLISILFVSCASSRKYLTHGKDLAIEQDRMFVAYVTKGEIPSQERLNELENNLWVKHYSKTSASNLLIRNWTLLDIFNSVNLNENKILYQVQTLTNNNCSIWSEGYSYWEYTRPFLYLWSKIFENELILNTILKVDSSFAITSYKFDSTYYPAPFGDLRFQPLRKELQALSKDLEQENVDCGFVDKSKHASVYFYNIQPKKVKLNTHVPNKENQVTIDENGKVNNFEFYQGYDKKYENRIEELLDYYQTLTQ